MTATPNPHISASDSTLAETQNLPIHEQLGGEMPESAHGLDTLQIGEPPAVLGSDAIVATGAGAEPVKKIRLRAKPKFTFPIPIRAIGFDLDGTLLDTASDIAQAANNMRAAFGFAPLPFEVIRGYIGKGIPNLVAKVLRDAVGEVGQTALKVAVANFEKQYQACFMETSKPFPGVFEGLNALRAKGFAFACVTNKAAQFTEPLLARHGFTEYFSVVVCGDTLAQKKPHPLPIQHAAKSLEVKVAELLVIGDSTNDAQAARAAGAPVFIVPYGYNEGQELRGLDCDAFIDDLSHAMKFVRMSS